jgi:hypothetical protein
MLQQEFKNYLALSRKLLVTPFTEFPCKAFHGNYPKPSNSNQLMTQGMDVFD